MLERAASPAPVSVRSCASDVGSASPRVLSPVVFDEDDGADVLLGSTHEPVPKLVLSKTSLASDVNGENSDSASSFAAVALTAKTSSKCLKKKRSGTFFRSYCCN